MEHPAYEDPQDRLGMSEAGWERFKRLTRGFEDQDESGVDLALLAENLRLTPTERLEKHRKVLKLVLEVERAGRPAGLSPRVSYPE